MPGDIALNILIGDIDFGVDDIKIKKSFVFNFHSICLNNKNPIRWLRTSDAIHANQFLLIVGPH